MIAISERDAATFTDIDWLRSLFTYVPETGHLIWKPRPHLRFAGMIAGSLNVDGYRQINFYDPSARRKVMKAHRIVWAIHNDCWPAEHIDHINGNRSDNRIENLRAASRAENPQNYCLPKTNTSGFLGVVYIKRDRAWVAQINVDGKKRYLGRADTAEGAHQLYLAGKARFHKFQPVPRERAA